MLNLNTVDVGDVILAAFPYEDKITENKTRPAVVMEKNDNSLTVFALKVTSTPPRDKYDYEIVNWALTGLKNISTVRTCKRAVIYVSDIVKKIGTLSPTDFQAVVNLYNQ